MPYDQIRTDQWHLSYLNVTEAHRHNRGSNVAVAVIDTKVEPHPDLRNNLLTGPDLTSFGPTDGREGGDFHGTAIAGLIAAHGRGNAGALGIAPEAKILPIRDRGTNSRGSSDNLAAGIDWAVTHGAKVICIASVGGPSPRLRTSVAAAVQKDVIVVAGAGNRPEAETIGFPAAYDGVLAVGATDRDGNHADVSVTGEQIAISAPGVDIYSTSINGKYSKATGTSASTAIVAGAVALVRSKYPDLSAQEVIHRLTATATDKGPPGRDEQYGYGVLNLVAALTADVPPLGSATTTTPATSAAASPPDEPERGNAVGVWLAVLGAAAAAVSVALLIGVRRRRR